MRDFSSIESSYWCLRTSINPEEDLRPLNFEKERERYLSSTRKQGSPEAPFFCYRKPDCRRHLRDIDSLIDSVSDVDHELQTKYMELTSSLKSWMVHFSEKENAFGAWLYSQFGKPDLDVVEAAIGQLKIIDDGDQEKDNEKLDPIDYFRCVLAGYRYDSWKFVTTSMPAKIRISSTEKTIYVDQNAIFSKLALDRLAKHEIGTHVLRHENGSLSNILLLRYGFPNYLETEEGLAIYSEESTGLLSNQDMRKYCLRVIASDLAEEHGFNEIFHELKKHTSLEESFAITARVKRGLTKTDEKGGYSKDQVYFSGLLKIRALCSNDLRALYLGKIGISDLAWAREQAYPSEIVIPEWIS